MMVKSYVIKRLQDMGGFFLPLFSLLTCELSDKENKNKSSRCGSAVKNLISIHEDAGSIPGLPLWVRSGIAISYSRFHVDVAAAA